VSGPLLDRFDLRVDVLRADPSERLRGVAAESTVAVADRVAHARELARARGVRCNAELAPFALDEHAPLRADATRALEEALRNGKLSGRGLHRVRRVARTIADLAGREGPISANDVAAAIAMRTDPSFLLTRLVG
jgi:magnesium chelatase family protein